jgi:hypothetical protein
VQKQKSSAKPKGRPPHGKACRERPCFYL